MAAVEALADLLVRFGDALTAGGVFLVVLAVVYAPGRLLVVPLLKRAEARIDVDETLTNPAIKIANAVFAVFALYAAVTVSGIASTPEATAAVTAAATIAVGFAAQDVLGNLVSGAFIVTDPKFHIGDWIRWNGKEGIVEDISFRVTRVHTFDNELITVPNSELTKHAVVNPASKDRLRVSLEFAIGYEDDIDHARDVLVETATDNDEILDRPRATVHVTELSDSYVGLTARFWISDPARTDVVRIESEYVQSVKERFDAAGIEMPYPYRQLTGTVETRSLPPLAGDEQ
jgi:small-conductance mechanosensitive channel